jgi:hypothetical protein
MGVSRIERHTREGELGVRNWLTGNSKPKPLPSQATPQIPFFYVEGTNSIISPSSSRKKE